MANNSGDSKNTLYCSFCGKSQHEVRKLIAGPTVFICDECVELCMDIIREETKASGLKSSDGVPTPKVKWSIQGQPADSVNGVAIETEDDASSFVVASMTSQFAGKVKVTAENSVGSDEAEFDIVVKGK